jgi:hypothetical protein
MCEVSMHDHLWAGIDRKLEEAASIFAEMAKSLQPPERTHMSVVLESSSAVLGSNWQSSFYSLVGTFLAKVRSVPSIIEACFGADLVSPPMRDWWDHRLPPDEQQRRQAFSAQFEADRKAFRDHYLTTERDVSEHRLGFPDIEGKVVGPFEQVHTATPLNRIPDAESRPLEPNINNDPALQWAATLPPRPVQPRWDQFTIAGKPLFPECRDYLNYAGQLAAKARTISQSVHGTHHLTRPPSS